MKPQTCFVLIGSCLAACATVANLLAIAIQAPSASSRPALFTEAQVQAGEAAYLRACASCHGRTLAGGLAPPLSGPGFVRSWRIPGVTLDDLYFVMRTTMPPRQSNALTADERAAVFAYILSFNGYPAGSSPLSANATALKDLRLDVAAVPAETAAPEPPAFVEGAAGVRPAPGGPDQAMLNGAAASTDWLIHNHDYSGGRYSPLAQVTVANAPRLAPVCIFQVGETDNFQTNPIVYNGRMFITTRMSTIALDAATCREQWRHTWQVEGRVGFQRNRGVAIKDGRILRTTPDGYLLALSADKGQLLWARHVANLEDGETFTMTPTVFEDLILAGPAGSENNVQGWVGAFRVDDGKQVWRFNTVPKPGEPGYETWKNPAQVPVGGGAVWAAFSLDPATGEVHVGVTNPAPDLPVHLRQGNNLYTNSVLALDVRTGKLRWHRQLVPNDSHDWDVTHATPLYSATINGAAHRLVASAGKDGMLRAIDRDSRNVVFETAVTTRENADLPVGLSPIRACPGVLGGVQWNGPAFSPRTNALYVPAVDWCTTFTAFEQVRHIPGKLYMGGTFDLDPPSKAQGWLTAVDGVTGAIRWKYRSPRPMAAAVTATAGDVLFTGELTGDFLALDARSGDVLYRFNTGGPMGGGVVTYAVDGRQYVAAASGSPSALFLEIPGATLDAPTGKGAGAPTIVVFALPR
jgi:PQQ-dependent dehydrogenase (methanol/ethanol family)